MGAKSWRKTDCFVTGSGRLALIVLIYILPPGVGRVPWCSWRAREVVAELVIRLTFLHVFLHKVLKPLKSLLTQQLSKLIHQTIEGSRS